MRVSCRSMLLSRRMEEERGGEGMGMLSLLRPAKPSCERCGVLLLLCCLVIVVLVSGLGILLLVYTGVCLLFVSVRSFVGSYSAAAFLSSMTEEWQLDPCACVLCVSKSVSMRLKWRELTYMGTWPVGKKRHWGCKNFSKKFGNCG